MENYNRIVKTDYGTYYYLDDRLHRIDGPAKEYVDGYKEWWIEGKQYSKKEFDKIIASLNNQVKMIIILVK